MRAGAARVKPAERLTPASDVAQRPPHAIGGQSFARRALVPQRAQAVTPTAKRIVLVGGGARCGKSAFALRRAHELGVRRLFIATAEARDLEMDERIAKHRRERGSEFETLEEPRALEAALQRSDADVIVIDCLTLWLSNLLLDGLDDDAIAARVDAFASVLEARRFHAVIVSNEVGMSLVPDNLLGRRFRDCTGRAHQRLAAVSDEIYFGVLGSLIRLQPEPLGLLRT
jgi:adenosylcobinamide kinase/adenosylcobinamide-phosphate guanylyltransferase